MFLSPRNKKALCYQYKIINNKRFTFEFSFLTKNLFLLLMKYCRYLMKIFHMKIYIKSLKKKNVNK